MDLSSSERALGPPATEPAKSMDAAALEDEAYLHLFAAACCRVRMDRMQAWGIEYEREHRSRNAEMEHARSCLQRLDDAGLDPSDLLHRMLDTEERNP